MKSKKACYNEDCSSFEDKIKYSSDFTYCPKCTSKLSYVCNTKDCYNNLDNVLKKYCDECLKKQQAKKDFVKDASIKIAARAVTVPKLLQDTIKVVDDVPKLLAKLPRRK